MASKTNAGDGYGSGTYLKFIKGDESYVDCSSDHTCFNLQGRNSEDETYRNIRP